ncbi:MAG: GtrA family protein, partial [Prevotella sp.]|nr:GtrA family protein [Prevotella sp.]
QSNILCLLYFSFSYIMLACMVPDHFVMSQFCILLTLWVAGEKLKKRSALNMWQTIVLFIFTAGMSLNNGLKVFLAALVTRRRRFFKPLYILFGIIVPVCLIWGFARWEYSTWEAPKYRARQEQKARVQQQRTENIRRHVIDSLKQVNGKEPDSVKAAQEVNRIIRQRAIAKYRHDHKQIWNKNTGKPFMKGEFMGWTDKTTSRWDVGVENLFGESIMFHENYLLGDVLRNRPVIVRYVNWFNYVVEGLLILCFLLGLWGGRHHLFMWTAMSIFLMDMTLHMGLGFGINEIYIMSPHYMFALPVVFAYLLKNIAPRWHRPATILIALMACYIFIWNVIMLTEYFS